MIEAAPPNPMILLDRSGVMEGDVAGTGLNRWRFAKQSLAAFTTEYDEKIRFGIASYSSCVVHGCSASSIDVAITNMNVSNRITVHGSYCDDLESGTVTQVDINYDCPMPPVG